LTDSFPEEGERPEVFLIARSHKGASHLQTGIDSADQGLGKAKKFMGVKTFYALLFQNKVSLAQAIGSHDFLLALVPNQKMQIALIEIVKIQTLARTFMHFTAGEFT